MRTRQTPLTQRIIGAGFDSRVPAADRQQVLDASRKLESAARAIGEVTHRYHLDDPENRELRQILTRLNYCIFDAQQWLTWHQARG